MKIKILAILSWLILVVFECKKEIPLILPKTHNCILDSTKYIKMYREVIGIDTIAL